MKRAYRRFHAERLEKKRKDYHGGTNHAFKLVDTPKPCSCFMCGNPRKWFKQITLKEKQHIKDLKTA